MFSAFITLMGWMLVCAISGPPLDAPWSLATEAYHAGKPEEAAVAFDRWIEIAAEDNVRSFEAHYNAGLAHGYASHGREASLHLIRASRLTLSPFKVSTVHRQLAKVQRELGVQDSLVNDFIFMLRLYLNPNVLALGASALLWTLLFTLGFALRYRDRWTWGLFSLNVLFALICVSSVLLAQQSEHRYGVVAGLSAINVTETDGEKLLELPPGTLVSYKHEADQVRILSPISGYTSLESIQEVSL